MGKLLSFSSAQQEAWSNGREFNWLCTQLAACRRFPVVIVLNQPIARQGGKASMVIGSCKNVSKLKRNVLLFSRPLCRANSNCQQNGRGYPVYCVSGLEVNYISLWSTLHRYDSTECDSTSGGWIMFGLLLAIILQKSSLNILRRSFVLGWGHQIKSKHCHPSIQPCYWLEKGHYVTLLDMCTKHHTGPEDILLFSLPSKRLSSKPRALCQHQCSSINAALCRLTFTPQPSLWFYTIRLSGRSFFLQSPNSFTKRPWLGCQRFGSLDISVALNPFLFF